MRLSIISPTGLIFEGEADSVTFPGLSGSFDVLPHHAPLISGLKAGVIRYSNDGQTHEQPIKSGFVKVKDETLTVCVE